MASPPDGPSKRSSRAPRMRWTTALHARFVHAVELLGGHERNDGFICKNAADFVSSIGKNHIVIISSLDSGKRRIIDASSDMQMYYLSSCNEDGSDPEYEGWKKLEDYNPSQKHWNCLASLVEGGHLSEDMDDDTDERTINDYYASLHLQHYSMPARKWVKLVDCSLVVEISLWTTT
ncbi:putative transcription factor KAN2 [Zea mays]|uniref:Putative transcription factor KAN2 n=1 Tax=Zea mays TaxID=4577 RepID=A0A3L6EM00_MAIZE|nr:putative transcription factor KAN2 [Zea mays]